MEIGYRFPLILTASTLSPDEDPHFLSVETADFEEENLAA
jgi:hypothetical protein